MDGTQQLVTDLQRAGAAVAEQGSFQTTPLSGRGVVLCVQGRLIQVYEYASSAERTRASKDIDPTDPSHIGNSIVEWAGNPRFWQRDRIIVQYLGQDPAIEVILSSVLGPPFAKGAGRGLGPDPTCR